MTLSTQMAVISAKVITQTNLEQTKIRTRSLFLTSILEVLAHPHVAIICHYTQPSTSKSLEPCPAHHARSRDRSHKKTCGSIPLGTTL